MQAVSEPLDVISRGHCQATIQGGGYRRTIYNPKFLNKHTFCWTSNIAVQHFAHI